jgi:hypothetical protein
MNLDPNLQFETSGTPRFRMFLATSTITVAALNGFSN